MDLKISLVDSRLTTTVYSKPTDSHLYLHETSCHKKSSINGITKGVALSLRRICSSDEDFQRKSTEYSHFLTARGHDIKKVKQSFGDVKSILRIDARKKVVRNAGNNYNIFATKFNPRGPDVYHSEKFAHHSG